MAFSLIAHTTGVGPGAFTTSAIDTTGADLIVITLRYYIGGGSYTLSDNKGNSWGAPAISLLNGANNSRLDLNFLQAPSVGTGHTLTLNLTSGDIAAGLAVAAFSGSAASPLDQTSSAEASSAGPITPTLDNELIVAATGIDNTASLSIDSGFTIVDTINYVGGNNYGGGLAYLVQGSAAAVNPIWSGAPNWMTLVASFKTGAAAAMLTSDIVSPVSFQGGMARDEANDIEWLSQGSTDRGVPGEWGISSLRDITGPSEWLLGWSTDRGTLSEWLSAPLRDIVTPIEALSHASIDGYLAGEWTGLAFMDIAVPSESLAQLVIDRVVPSGWLGTSLLTSVASLDFISTLVSESLAPVEYEGEIRFASESAVPIEWLGSFLLDRGLPIEAVLEAAADRRTRMEWLAPAILDTALPGEITVSLAGDRFVPIEFEGNLLLISDRILPIEWSALPGIARVSLERLLGSPGKRRILGTPGRLRLLKRQ